MADFGGMRQNVDPEPTRFPDCYRHRGVEMAVKCSRCANPICTDCMIDASVGYQCPACARRGAKRSPTVAAPWKVGSNPMSTMPVTIVLIAINLAVFLVGLIAVDVGHSIGRYGQVAPVLVSPDGGISEWYRIFTNMFIHLGWLHVAFNMFVLYVVGRVLEPLFGRWWFLGFYLVAGIVGSGVYVLLADWLAGAVGASGAVYGLLGAMLALSFQRRHTSEGKSLFGQVILFLVINIALTFSVPNIAWQAHAGGFAAGIVIGFVYDYRRDLLSRFAILAACLVAAAVFVLVRPAPAPQFELVTALDSATKGAHVFDTGSIDTGADNRPGAVEVDARDCPDRRVAA